MLDVEVVLLFFKVLLVLSILDLPGKVATQFGLVLLRPVLIVSLPLLVSLLLASNVTEHLPLLG